MKKVTLFVSLFLFASAMSVINAQSIGNRSWKTYISQPINDTVTLHLYSGSSHLMNSQGEIKVRSHCKINGDTMTILDYGTEQMGCPDMKGVYKINLSGNSFTLTLIEDPCEGRAGALINRKWTEASKL